MKKHTKTSNASNESLEPVGRSAKDSTSQSPEESATAAPNTPDREELSRKDGMTLPCGGCYLESTIESTIQLLQAVRASLEEKAEKAEIDEGIEKAKVVLEGLLEEIRSKPHGAGMPERGPIRVRPVIVVVAPKK